MFELKAHYRETVTYQIYGVIGLIVLPFSIWALWIGNYLLALPPAITVVLSLSNAFYYRHKKTFLLPPILVSYMYVIDNMLAIWQLGVPALFWAYPTMLAFFVVHPRKVTQHLVPLLCICICSCCYFFAPPEYLPRVGATLFAMAILFQAAAGMMEQQYQETQRLSITDHLTGAYNRRYMDSKIEELIEDQKRNHTTSAMIGLDVDHFKSINDRFGHSLGDKVLVNLVELLQRRVRVLDKVCRSGGEEFIILLPGTTQDQAYTLAEDLRLEISKSKLLRDSNITVSCGIAALVPGDSRDVWLNRSDSALYKAKASGRNRVVIGQVSPSGTFATV